MMRDLKKRRLSASTSPQVVGFEKVWVLLLQLLPNQACEGLIYLGIALQCLHHILVGNAEGRKDAGVGIAPADRIMPLLWANLGPKRQQQQASSVGKVSFS